MADFTTRVLRNKGVSVQLYRFDQGAQVFDDNDEPVLETRWLRFDMNALAELEIQFGSFEGWHTAMTANPSVAIRKTVAMLLELDEKEAGKRVPTEGMREITAACIVAYGLANGLDPQAATAVLAAAVAEKPTVPSAALPVLPKLPTPASSPDGTGNGFVPVGAPLSSGV